MIGSLANGQSIFAHSPVLSMQGPTVIIVDHDAAVRDALSASLGAGGYAVLTFGSANDLIKSLPLGERGCLLVEFDLGDMNGLDLVAHLSTMHLRLPAIIMSARLRRPFLIDPMPDGVVGFLEKPFGQDEILAKLQLALGPLS